MKRIGPGTYTRGWETVGHFISLFRASVRLHLLVSLILGLIIGAAWFWSGLSPEERSMLPGHVIDFSGFGSLSSTVKTLSGSGDSGSETIPDLTSPEAQALPYGGRTPGFLAYQLLFRVAVVFVLSLLFFGLLVYRRGQRLGKDEFRRGVQVVDAKKQKRRASLIYILRMSALSLVLGSMCFYVWLGNKGARSLPDYLWSSAYVSVPFLAHLAGPSGNPLLAWYELDKSGFRNSAQVKAAIAKDVFDNKSAARLLELWLCAIFGTGAALFIGDWKLKSMEPPDDRIHLAQVPIEKESECSHFLFSGSPGSGKSTAIKELLDQVRARGERAIVYDPSGEYIAPYYREDRDVILNPLDKRSAIWTPWADARSPTDFDDIARSLFPRGGREPFWNDAGAALFAACAQKVALGPKPTNKFLHHLLTTGSIRKLAEFTRGTNAAKFLDSGAGNMPANLIATVTTRVSALDLLGDPEYGQQPFSIRQFVAQEDSDSWLFLSMRQDQQAALKPLVSLWCDLASTAILSQPPNSDRRVWVILDEVASLQRLPALQPLLAQGRKHGAAVVLGLQSIPQLRDSYGRDAAAALASQPQTWLALRIVEPDTARWVERALGEAEVDETRESVSMGADSHRDGVSLQKNTRKEPAAMATELMSLPDLQGYLKLAGSGPVHQVNFQWRQREEQASIFIPKEGWAKL